MIIIPSKALLKDLNFKQIVNRYSDAYAIKYRKDKNLVILYCHEPLYIYLLGRNPEKNFRLRLIDGSYQDIRFEKVKDNVRFDGVTNEPKSQHGV